MKKVLLVCGTGASSGFMAGNIRKAAQARGKEYEILARSDTVVEDYIDTIDLLLVGPHLDYMLDDLKEIAKDYHVPVELISKEAYGNLDGEAILDFIIEKIG